uniref:Uncharacterized protein n=1 Tax=Tanacetum cinerariifolium TaxID=118510 RepID=A0A6L2LX65_TANCI|nr:hypothetical protein [Tanacetum cinerariifolium]
MNYMQQRMKNPEEISNPTTALDMALELMAKAFQLNNTTPTNNNLRKIENQYGNGNVVAAPAEGNGNGINETDADCSKGRRRDSTHFEEFYFMATASACEETERDNANYTLENNLQQASTSGTQSVKALVYDSDGSAEKMDLGYQNPFYLKQAQQKQQSLYNGKVLFEKHDPLDVYDSEEILQLAQESRLIMKQLDKEIKLANYTEINHLSGVFVSQTVKSREESYFLNTSKTANVSKSFSIPNEEFLNDTTLSVAQKFLNEVSRQNDTTRGMSVNTKFAKQSILGKPPSSSRHKLYAVTPLPKSTIFPKVGETNSLSNQVTSNSVPSSKESYVMKNDNVLSPGIFRMNHFKASRVDNFVPNKHVKASVRTKPIIVSQPHVITKNDVNSKTNSFSPKDVKSTTQPKSSQLSNNLEKIEEKHKNLQSSMLNYMNGMNSRGKKQKEYVFNIANQTKHKAQVWKPKNVGSKERLASPKPSTSRSCLRWSPTGRMLDLKGKIITTSESNQRDLARNTPLDRVEVLGMFEKGVNDNKGIVPTEMELVLEQTQQGTSHEVLVSTEGVEELKIIVRIKGVKKEAFHATLGKNRVNT